MIRHFFALTLGASLFLSTAPAFAAVETYKLENPHTQVTFAVNHLGFSNSIGKFTDYNGDMTFDRDHPENSSVTVTIKTDSLDMGNATWEEHVESDKLLDAAKYPEMTFKSTKIDVTGEKTARITGDLSLHGVTKPVMLDVVMNGVGQHPFGLGYFAGFSATGTIKRSEFGMGYGIPNVADDVILRIEVEAVRQDKPVSEQ